MAITDYHRAIFDFLETYRAEHPEANLTYSLRQKQGKKNGRLRNIYLFTGTDNYISIGLYEPISNASKIRSICFETGYDSATDSLINSHLTVIYSDPHLITQEAIYQRIIEQIGPDQFKKNGKNRRYELHYTDPDWRVNLRTYLDQHKPIIDQVLREAGVTGQFHIPEEELEAAIRVANQGPSPARTEEDYSWIPFYRELCSEIWSSYTPAGLIAFVKQALTVQKLTGLNDQDADGKDVELADMDPYTFLSFIARGTDEKRLMVLAKLKEWLSLDTPAPTGLSGLYSDQNQWIWLFGYSYERQPQDIVNIWELCEQVERDTVSGDLFNEVLAITRLTPARLSESLFAHRPDQYFPVNSKTKAWLKKRSLPYVFQNFLGYQQILNAVRQHDSRPFYEISAEAFLENSKMKDPTLPQYFWAEEIYFSEFDRLDHFLDQGIWKDPFSFDPDHADFVVDIPVGTKLAVKYCAEPPQEKTEYTVQIKAIGVVTSNPGDGETLLMDWDMDFVPFNLTFDTVIDGFFAGSLEEVTWPEHIQRIFFHQPASPMPEQPTIDHPKNIILYGPPGTGKTYGTIDLAVDIVDGRKDRLHTVNKPRFDQLRKEDQIEFITFHQSYTYEDFVMGLKPDVDGEDLKFQRSYGIFYRMAKRARDNYEASQTDVGMVTTRPFQEVFDEFMSPLVEDGKEINVKMASGTRFVLYDLSERSVSFRKPNGSTIHTLSIATLRSIYEGLQEVRPNGLKPYYRPLTDELARLGQQTRQQVTPKNYVLIIDEINRANMSRVFGELITLLEDDKRLGADNELTVTLPSGEPFAVPPNLYLIGTMNTADKSLALLDIALRRRFDFQYQRPDPDLLASPAKEILTKLNKAIRDEHKPADFLIGHAYFIGKTEAQLPEVFNNRVIPLLMEYFNGKATTVIKLLDKAGVAAISDEITDEITVDNVG